MKREYMPISIAMTGRRCLVVGGGAVALRKVENLLAYGADVTVVAPQALEVLQEHARQGRITLKTRAYRPREAGGYGLVVSATDDRALNQRIYDDARSRGVLVNVVDDPPRCDFIVPAVVRRDCLSVAVDTDGKAPFMSGHLRAILEDLFPRHWGRLMQTAAAFRLRVRERWPDDEQRRRQCFAHFVQADWTTMIAEMNNADIDEVLTRMVEEPSCEVSS